jgi:hypothetical protein
MPQNYSAGQKDSGYATESPFPLASIPFVLASLMSESLTNKSIPDWAGTQDLIVFFFASVTDYG